jgi:hypothetical protein
MFTTSNTNLIHLGIFEPLTVKVLIKIHTSVIKLQLHAYEHATPLKTFVFLVRFEVNMKIMVKPH